MAKTIPIGRATIGIKCGDCIHFKRMEKFGKPCSELGKKHFADAPDCYSPDVYLMAKHTPDILYQLALLMKDFTAQETRVYLSLLRKSKTFEKAKLKFGQPVYFSISGDYLGNYYRGFVLDVTSSAPQNVFVTSDLRKTQRNNPMIGAFMRDSILTIGEFKKRKLKLQKQGRLVDPKPTFSATVNKSELANIDYQPPSMETAPQEWFDKQAAKKKKPKKRLDGTLEFRL